ncbi:hypothetical protein RBB76_15415 [Tunturiibacter psychrotolerans]|uniref:hypothetical protein n=1 Tax=Tunturiibacter psychrotolerans TaxID=3069686 RepID=UPI003D9B7B2D
MISPLTHLVVQVLWVRYLWLWISSPQAFATHTALAFGDFQSYYTLRSVTGNAGGFQIARDPYTYLVSKGPVAFIGYGRGGF